MPFFLSRHICLFGVLLSAFMGASFFTSVVRAAPLIPAVTSFVLDNGMQVVVIPDRRAPVVTHMVWYRIGSADEPEGSSGVAHFLEHLLFKGTPSYPGNSFSQLVMANGGMQNAFTYYDYTGYYQRVAEEHLPLVMSLEADRMVNLVLNKEIIQAERDVVLEERRSRIDNDPGSQLVEEMYSALYRAHPYRRPVIGWEGDIAALDHLDALKIYQTFYTPNNAVLVVAGDVDVDDVVALARKIYGQIESRNMELKPRRRFSEPPQRSERRVTVVDARVQQPIFKRYYDVQSYNVDDKKGSEALDFLARILGGGATSRLYRRLVVERGIAASVFSAYDGYMLDNGQFIINAVPNDVTSLPDIEAEVDREIAQIVAEGVSDAELERIRALKIASIVYLRDNQFSIADMFGTALMVGLSVEDMQSLPERIAAITTDDIRRAAGLLLRNASVTGILKASDAGSVRQK